MGECCVVAIFLQYNLSVIACKIKIYVVTPNMDMQKLTVHVHKSSRAWVMMLNWCCSLILYYNDLNAFPTVSAKGLTGDHIPSTVKLVSDKGVLFCFYSQIRDKLILRTSIGTYPDSQLTKKFCFIVHGLSYSFFRQNSQLEISNYLIAIIHALCITITDSIIWYTV